MVIFISILLFALGMICLSRVLFMPKKGDRPIAKNKRGRTEEAAAGIDALMRRLDEEAEARKKDGEVIQSLQEHIGRLEGEGAGKGALSGRRRPKTAQLLSNIEGLRKVAAEQKKATRDIRKHIEEDKIKFRL